jgi:hypothetical protein
MRQTWERQKAAVLCLEDIVLSRKFVWASRIVSKDSTCLTSTLDLDDLHTFRTVKWGMSNLFLSF